jgi:ribosomal protein S18 acetylase RimI-like enzyme
VSIRAPAARDLDAVAALLGVPAALVRSEWELPGFDLGRDAWLAGDDGYAAVMAGGRLALAAPDRATADALVDLAAARARELGFVALRLTTGGDGEPATGRPFVRERETLELSRPLDRPLPEAAWPDGVAVRTFTPPDGNAVQALLDEAYRAWDAGYVPLAHDDWLRWMTGDIEFDPTVWWLAERDGELVGCALHWRSGFLKDLAVRASERGRGLGAALVVHGLAEFARRGVPRVRLKVDAANPTGAVRLYERLGFVLERREATWALTL